MARVPSNMIPLGSTAPDFTLPETVSLQQASLTSLAGKSGTVIMFICNHCPFVKHVNDELIRLAKTYIPKNVAFIAISSNDVGAYPDDGPEKMKTTSEQLGYPFPYLYDESQAVAKAYDAACTPDFYIYDGNLQLVYRGQLDDSRPGNNIPVTGVDMRAALDALLQGKAISETQKPSIGCNIKWKAS